MSHLSHETLWSLARRDATPPELAAGDAHVEACPSCREQLSAVQSAQLVLSMMPVPPRMPAALSRAVAVKLEAKFQRPERWWWPFESLSPRMGFAFAGAAVAAAAVLLLMVGGSAHTSGEDGTSTGAIASGSSTAGNSPTQPAKTQAPAVQVAAAAPRKLTVKVSSVKRAKTDSTALTAEHVLAEGSTISTEKAGAAALELPDGTVASLTGSTAVALTTLEEKQLTLDVKQGALELDVPHREDRVLTVTAGAVTVRDLGTRFSVQRESERVVVQVTEGSVEVSVAGEQRIVHIGETLTWANGKTEMSTAKPAPVRGASAAETGKGPSGGEHHVAPPRGHAQPPASADDSGVERWTNPLRPETEWNGPAGH